MRTQFTDQEKIARLRAELSKIETDSHGPRKVLAELQTELKIRIAQLQKGMK